MGDESGAGDMDLVGEIIHGYRLTRVIGEGGTAIVYEGQSSDRGPVAVKVLLPSIANNPIWPKQFQREFEVVSGLGHPRIVPVYEFGIERNYVYLIQRLMPSGSLMKRIDNHMLRQTDAIQIIADIANALDYAHSRGVVHLDIKPSNILFDEANQAYLCDFGIAHLLLEGNIEIEHNVGTIGYSAPEIWQLNAISRQSDIYSLGIMCFQILTGKMPFGHKTILQGMKSHISQTIPPISTFIKRSDIDTKQLDGVLWKATAADPQVRYATAGDFAEDFLHAFSLAPDDVLWELGGQTRRRKSANMNKVLLSIEQNQATSYEIDKMDDLLKKTPDQRRSRRYQHNQMQEIGDAIADLKSTHPAKDRTTDILNYGSSHDADFGVAATMIALPNIHANILNQAHGMMITEVHSNSIAQAVGLFTGDILISINHEKLETQADFSIALKHVHHHQLAPTLQILRAGVIMTLPE